LYGDGGAGQVRGRRDQPFKHDDLSTRPERCYGQIGLKLASFAHLAVERTGVSRRRGCVWKKSRLVEPGSGMLGSEHGRAVPRLIAAGRDVFKDAVAGLLAAIVLIANIVSFGALMFPGDLSAGTPVVI
jgi:hypothetical protein